MSTNLKAYMVSCRDDDHGAIVQFAKRAKDVSRNANSECCDCEWIDRRVKRAPQFDDCAPGPMTIADYLAKGWFWECTCCGEHCYEDCKPVIVAEHVFCNDDCVCGYLASYREWGTDGLHESLSSLLAKLREYLESKGVSA